MIHQIILCISTLFYVTASDIDPKGYVVYCPCMGRFGNQADHFLGTLAFAKGLDRTLILPPWVEYHQGKSRSVQVPFDRYFKVKPLEEYLRVITMEKFMKELAPSIWPVGKRTVFCYGPREKLNGGTTPSCNAKDGNPFGSFWDTFNIDFDASEFYGPLFYDVKHPQVVQQWNEKYSPKKFPVLAFTGAPAGFPVHEEHVQLHKYLKWSNFINDKAERFIRENIPNKGKFLGIHMRNGVDWERACEHVGMQKLFASPQCLGYFNEYGKEVTKEMCFPSEKTVLAQIKKAAKTIKASSIFVATDDKPMLDKISKHLKSMKVKIVQHLPADPHVDLAILGKADHYIGNCVSTFSAFAKRERDSTGKSSSFWGFERQDFTGHTEL